MPLTTGDVPYASMHANGAANTETRLTIEFTVRDETGQVDDVLIAGAIRQTLEDSGAVTNITAVRHTAAATEIS